MSSNKRQELYDRIRATSKDEVILEEMKRLGFWPASQDKAEFSETLIQRKGELRRELNELVKKQRLYADPEKALKEMRKQRMAESKQRQKENKERKLTERYEKKLRWHKRRQQEIVYLGEKVSAGLNNTTLDKERLDRYQLPHIATAKALSGVMGISLAELRFLSYNRDIAHINHYQHFTVPKKTGGVRLISAPMPRLKRAQYWVLANILEKIPLHDAAHGFRPGRSIVSNAQPHCQADIVINHDFKDFFPSLRYPRIRGLYRGLGYSEQVASLLALLTTESDTLQVELDGECYYVKQGERYLPQGAPSSPALTNILCRRLDARLRGAAQSLGFLYTRYADDVTFSGSHDSAKNLSKLQWRLEHIVAEEGFELHPEKSRIMRNSAQQEVTGIVVNQKPAIDRKTLRRFRALLHRMAQQGPEGCYWGRSSNVLTAAKGFAHFVAMVDGHKGRGYLEQIDKIIQRYGHEPLPVGRKTALSPAQFKAVAATGQAPRNPWWITSERPLPVAPNLERKQVTQPKKALQQELIQQEERSQQVVEQSSRSEHGEGQDNYQSLPGILRRMIGSLPVGLAWILITLAGLVLFRISPILGFLFVIALVYFIRGMSRH
jgi:hypothetical protein